MAKKADWRDAIRSRVGCFVGRRPRRSRIDVLGRCGRFVWSLSLVVIVIEKKTITIRRYDHDHEFVGVMRYDYGRIFLSVLGKYGRLSLMDADERGRAQIFISVYLPDPRYPRFAK